MSVDRLVKAYKRLIAQFAAANNAAHASNGRALMLKLDLDAAVAHEARYHPTCACSPVTQTGVEK